ncbi:MAG: nitroreductase family protein [Halobacteria archaeon]
MEKNPTENPLLRVLTGHLSVRRYTDEPVEPEDLRAVEEAGRRSPTDASGHLYAFVRVTDPALRQRLFEICGRQEHVLRAPEFLVACADFRRVRLLLGKQGKEFSMGPRAMLLFGTLDAAIAGRSMAVAAQALGYGICFVGAVQNRPAEVAEALKLPEGVLPLFGLCVGRPAEPLPAQKPRLPPEALFMENRYREADDGLLAACLSAMESKKKPMAWPEQLNLYFGKGGIFEKREEEMRRAAARAGFSRE